MHDLAGLLLGVRRFATPRLLSATSNVSRLFESQTCGSEKTGRFSNTVIQKKVYHKAYATPALEGKVYFMHESVNPAPGDPSNSLWP